MPPPPWLQGSQGCQSTWSSLVQDASLRRVRPEPERLRPSTVTAPSRQGVWSAAAVAHESTGAAPSCADARCAPITRARTAGQELESAHSGVMWDSVAAARTPRAAPGSAAGRAPLLEAASSCATVGARGATCVPTPGDTQPLSPPVSAAALVLDVAHASLSPDPATRKRSRGDEPAAWCSNVEGPPTACSTQAAAFGPLMVQRRGAERAADVKCMARIADEDAPAAQARRLASLPQRSLQSDLTARAPQTRHALAAPRRDAGRAASTRTGATWAAAAAALVAVECTDVAVGPDTGVEPPPPRPLKARDMLRRELGLSTPSPSVQRGGRADTESVHPGRHAARAAAMFPRSPMMAMTTAEGSLEAVLPAESAVGPSPLVRALALLLDCCQHPAFFACVRD
jgi:hypothetical protein